MNFGSGKMSFPSKLPIMVIKIIKLLLRILSKCLEGEFFKGDSKCTCGTGPGIVYHNLPVLSVIIGL